MVVEQLFILLLLLLLLFLFPLTRWLLDLCAILIQWLLGNYCSVLTFLLSDPYYGCSPIFRQEPVHGIIKKNFLTILLISSELILKSFH
jgi:hypothetical protein